MVLAYNTFGLLFKVQTMQITQYSLMTQLLLIILR